MDPNVYTVADTQLALRDRAKLDAAKLEHGTPAWAMLDGYRMGVESGLAAVAGLFGYRSREDLERATYAERDRQAFEALPDAEQAEDPARMGGWEPRS